jgi:undecaprenyl-diphosphatase
MIVLKALILGIVEGVTEFLPISSTGHLIIATRWVAYPEAQAAAFDVFIQFGAILAVVYHFRDHLWGLVQRAPSEAAARDLMGKVLLAFVPAAVVGVLLHDAIEEHLFHPRTVALALIAGGVVILLIERGQRVPEVHRLEATGWRHAWWIGVAQVASLFPGVSRAGATIIGGLLAGLDRPAATQFSFYLSIPTMFAASGFALLKNLDKFTAADALPLAIGFGTAFASALIVVRVFIAYVQRHDFKAFGYYRIVLGLVVLALFR